MQPLAGGATAVTLVASHTVVDGLALTLAATEAADGVTRDLGYPAPGTRTRAQALREDALQTVRDVPEMAKAVAAAVRLARSNTRRSAPRRPAGPAPPDKLDGVELVTAPSVVVYMDEELWISRVESLGWKQAIRYSPVSPRRLGQILGRVDPDGMVKLSFPVSERTEGDTRGNALSGMMLTIDPTGVDDQPARRPRRVEEEPDRALREPIRTLSARWR